MARLLSSTQLEALCWLAAASIESWLEGRRDAPAAPDDSRLSEPGASFVTLTHSGQLRGCIGMLQPVRPLWQDVWENARAAAARDPRFPPLAKAEWPDTDVEVSVLGAPEPIPADSEAELLARLRPGEDGLTLIWRGHRGTFLPDVWSQLPAAPDFLRHLKQKAGLPPDFWAPDMVFERYTTQRAYLTARQRSVR
ncbi:MAG: AmmeMemoRadiSam system protein A [Gammaproteobacteria bacterium]|nr:MAG: AmmeMemoRadiSam system protein A [Gammaproteobacteria bacterium]